MDKQVFYIFDHDENEEIVINTLEDFIEWLNYSNDNYSFSLDHFTFDKRSA